MVDFEEFAWNDNLMLSVLGKVMEDLGTKGHFTHETKSPWPLHFKHSHWWKKRSRSKFASHYAWETNRVCECKMDCKVYMDSYTALYGSSFMVIWTIFKNHLLEVGCWFSLFHHVWRSAWIEIHWNSIWLRAWSHMTSHFTWRWVRDHTTWIWRCVGITFGHFLLGSHNFMVTALGSYVKWPLLTQEIQGS